MRHVISALVMNEPGVLALVAGITAAVFAQSTYPLLFLPLLCVLFATYFLGATGAILPILVVFLLASRQFIAGITAGAVKS